MGCKGELMLGDLELYALFILIAVSFFWMVPARQADARQGLLTAVSAFAVLIYSPGGFLVALYLLMIPMFSLHFFRKGKSLFLFWTFLGLVLMPMVGLRILTTQPFILSFGVAFATTKSIALLVTAYGGRIPLRWRDAALLIFFFPLFTVGPVEKLATFASDRFQNRVNWSDISLGLTRIVFGLFTVIFICNTVLSPIRDDWFGRGIDDIAAISFVRAWGLLISSFLFTYLNFVGFSEVAIGVSRLFGLKIVENFDRPLLVTNVADFWKRYHISMGNWINQFLFFPIAIFIKRDWGPYAATMIAFVLFGMWHDFTLNYLFWGLGNGAGVVLVHWAQRNNHLPLAKNNPIARAFIGPMGGIVALSWVGFLQTMANLGSIQAAGLFALRLIGL
jgi:D-alanyl-lipoteichoic acid acyltransferase DltB (MBOAT superfamily)